ncbi:MAG: TldD/PmbA family protein [Deltaproteobacteria bacterium]|nr:TldD/PmbA family protein [Deltaproteobacteria bacterium]
MSLLSERSEHLEHFERARALVLSMRRPGEGLMGYWMSETSDFVRFTRGGVRQAGRVEQRELRLALTVEGRRASLDVTLSGAPADDARRLAGALDRLRALAPALPPDPHLCDPPPPDAAPPSPLPPPPAGEPSAGEALGVFLGLSAGLDVVGILSSGTVARGFLSGEGLTRWSERAARQVDWSVVQSADRAVKCGWAGEAWDLAALERKLSEARAQLAALARPAHTPAPGALRALLSPAALADLLGAFSDWGGWSAQALHERQSPLGLLASGARRFSPLLSVYDAAGGAAPAFQAEGHLRPARHPLVVAGGWGAPLVSPRSARRLGLSSTGAPAHEAPQTLEVEAGALPSSEALAALGTGVYVSDVWYLNFSDRAAACVTGTTRFATLWVEGGAPVAPLSVMRFDDCLYDVLGERLEALTVERDLSLSASTYDRRSLSSTLTPAALCAGLRFTL